MAESPTEGVVVWQRSKSLSLVAYDRMSAAIGSVSNSGIPNLLLLIKLCGYKSDAAPPWDWFWLMEKYSKHLRARDLGGKTCRSGLKSL